MVGPKTSEWRIKIHYPSLFGQFQVALCPLLHYQVSLEPFAQFNLLPSATWYSIHNFQPPLEVS